MVAQLPSGTILAHRFEVLDWLGSGGFGIAYRCVDHKRSDTAVLKELAPTGSSRDALRMVLPPASSQVLKSKFQEEARRLSKLQLSCVPEVRAYFEENGTAYFAVDDAPDARPMSDRIGNIEMSDFRQLWASLLDALEDIHQVGLIHRDLKPSNILVFPDFRVWLIDFGAAREWHLSHSQSVTTTHTPGYSPPEQLGGRSSLTPSADVYALCATAYHVLTGTLLPSAPARAAGEDYLPIEVRVPHVDRSLSLAIQAGLALRVSERPHSIAALRDLELSRAIDPSLMDWNELDQKLWASRQYRHDPWACPGCQSPLIKPKPGREGACPVCREGKVVNRKVTPNLCPVCRESVLHRKDNRGVAVICPACTVGILRETGGLFRAKRSLHCTECGFSAEKHEHGLGDESWEVIRARSGRAEVVWTCASCHSVADELPDGRLRFVNSELVGEVHFPEEWTNLSHGLAPDSGNAVCQHCHADFYRDDHSLTLLREKLDPWGVSENLIGRRIAWSHLPWLASGKQSPQMGLLCTSCHSEWDESGEGVFALVTSRLSTLRRWQDHEASMEEWGRIAEGLPLPVEWPQWETALEDSLYQAYLEGEIGFRDDADLAWRGDAMSEALHGSGRLEIRGTHLTFGGLLRRTQIDLMESESVTGERITLLVEAGGETIDFVIEPMTLSVRLKSMTVEMHLKATDLARRLRAAMS